MAKKNQATEGLKKTLGGTKRDDRQAGDKFTFEPITIDVKNALTVIYMLKSPEDDIVLRGVASLEKFAKKAKENLQLLTSLGIFEYLLPLVRHNDYVIKRFGQKLIGMLCSLQEFRDQMFTIQDVMDKMVEILEKESDIVMHEYSALALAELTKECQAATKLLKVQNSIDILFLRITSPDPDVEKNCLDTMANLLNDIEGMDYFLESPSFDMKSLLTLTSSSFPAIQSQVLQVLNQLTAWNKDTRVLHAFRDAFGIQTIIGILENQDWKDLHAAALDIINNVGDNPGLCDYLLQTGCLGKCVNILDGCVERHCVERLLGVLARISQNEAGRVALHINHVEDRFIQYLQQGWDNAQESAVLGIAHMCHYPKSLNYIMENNPIPQLIDVLTDGGKTWTLRHLSAYALNILAQNDQRTCIALHENQRHHAVLKILKTDLKIPAETCTNIINIFTGLSIYPNCRLDMLDENLILSLLECIQDPETEIVKPASVQLAALECLSRYLIEMAACKILTDLNGTEKIIGCLKSRYASIRQWAAHIVVQASQNPEFVKRFIQRKGLKWLIQERDYKFSVPSWELAIEAIFQKYLPAKFAYLGRLDINDITDEGFFIQRHYRKEFLVLEDLLRYKMSPMRPIYVANFQNLPMSDSESQLFHLDGTQNPNKKKEDTYENETANGSSINDASYDSSPSYKSLTEEQMDDLLNKKYGKAAPDPYLPEYLEKLKKRLIRENPFKGDPKWYSIHPNFVKERARILAEFVADQMAGPDPYIGWNPGYLEMHLNDIKLTLGTNIIPLGYIRYGSYTERAILFKILADRVGLPCALIRGSYGRLWVEISIPVLGCQEEDGLSSSGSRNSKTCLMSDQDLYGKISKQLFPSLQPELFNALPNKLLKPNAIVDLMDDPGKILPLNSYEADVYRGIYQFKNCEGN